MIDASQDDARNDDIAEGRHGPVQLDNAEATLDAGRKLARQICAANEDRLTIFLAGDLGAGKTTFARGFLEALGHSGRVPSPTYTLIEPYELNEYVVYHVDLYRLAGSRDIDDLGLTELPGPGVLLLIEWPERAGARLGPADLAVALALPGDENSGDENPGDEGSGDENSGDRLPGKGRRMVVTPATAAGRRVLAHEIAK